MKNSRLDVFIGAGGLLLTLVSVLLYRLSPAASWSLGVIGVVLTAIAIGMQFGGRGSSH